MKPKCLCILLLGLFAFGTVLGQNEEIPIENDNQFPSKTTSETEVPPMTSVDSTTLLPQTEGNAFDPNEAVLPGILALDVPEIPSNYQDSDSETTNTTQEQQIFDTTIASSFEENEVDPISESIPQEDIIKTTSTGGDEIKETTTPAVENTEADTDTFLEQTATTSQAETNFMFERKTTNEQDETITPLQDEETITTPQDDITTSLNEEETITTPEEDIITSLNEEKTITTPQEDIIPSLKEEETITTPQEDITTLVNEAETITTPQEDIITSLNEEEIITTPREDITTTLKEEETTTTLQKDITVSLQDEETTTTPQEDIAEQERKTTPTGQGIANFGAILDDISTNTPHENEIDTTQPDFSLIDGMWSIFKTSLLAEKDAITEKGTNKPLETFTETSQIKDQTETLGGNENLQQMLNNKIEESVIHSVTVEPPKGELVKDTNASQTSGVDKSVIGIVVIAMIVIVAIIVIKKNWTSIRKRFKSTPNRAHNEYTAVKTNGTAEDFPLQDKADKSPV